MKKYIIFSLLLSGCSFLGPTNFNDPQTITVSYYGKGNYFKGRQTANGEIFDPALLTAAHRTLPFGTYLHLTNPANNKQTLVRVNDRGPFIRGRELDVSYQAACELGIVQQGVAQVVAKQVF